MEGRPLKRRMKLGKMYMGKGFKSLLPKMNHIVVAYYNIYIYIYRTTIYIYMDNIY